MGSEVWVLSSRRLLTGDTAAEGTDLIGGTEEVYATQDAALDRLREFMRPLVNESRPEGAWDEDERNVDDVLDEIIEKEVQRDVNHIWLHDGSTQSFMVSLTRQEVRQ